MWTIWNHNGLTMTQLVLIQAIVHRSAGSKKYNASAKYAYIHNLVQRKPHRPCTKQCCHSHFPSVHRSAGVKQYECHKEDTSQLHAHMQAKHSMRHVHYTIKLKPNKFYNTYTAPFSMPGPPISEVCPSEKKKLRN